MRKKALSTLVVAVIASFFMTTDAQAAASLRTLQLGAQSPSVAGPGGLAYFLVTVTRAGTGSMNTYLSVSGLPGGAIFEFVPPELAFDDQGPSTKNATLVVRLSTDIAPGTYTVSISARHGSSPQVLTGTTTLLVSGSAVVMRQPWLDIPVRQPDGTVLVGGIGTPSQPILIQATTDLGNPNSWETIAVQTLDESGFFALVDADSAIYPARFYRAIQ